VRRHVIAGDERRGERDLAGEQGGGDDLRQAPRLAGADAAEDAEALGRGAHGGAAADGGDHQRGQVHAREQRAVVGELERQHADGGVCDVGDVLPAGDEEGGEADIAAAHAIDPKIAEDFAKLERDESMWSWAALLEYWRSLMRMIY